MSGPRSARAGRARLGWAVTFVLVPVMLGAGWSLAAPTASPPAPLGAAQFPHHPGAVAPNLAPTNASAGLAWLHLTGAAEKGAPAARVAPAMAFDPALNATILFGGEDVVSSPCCSESAYGDFWSYAHGSWTDLTPTVLPPTPRFSSLMAWDPADQCMVLFGGYTILAKTGQLVGPLHDTWTFANGSWQQLTPRVSPPGYVYGAMAWDAADGYMVMYGGENDSAQGGGYTLTISNDTWSFVGGQWTNRTARVSGDPPPLEEQAMAYDPSDREIVMYGGSNDSGNLNQTWTYSGDTWELLATTNGPPTLWGEVMATDPPANGAVLFGGTYEVSYPSFIEQLEQSTWLFANGSWTNLTSQISNRPPAESEESLTYQANEGYLLMFGGSTRTQTNNDTWTLGPPVVGGFTATPSPTDVGLLTVLNATPIGAVGTVSFSFSGLPVGCTAANLSILTCTPRAVGTYHLVVTLNDSLGYTTTVNLTLRVNSDPEVAAFTATPAALTIGASVTFATRATGGTPSYRNWIAGLPPGCGFFGPVNFTCTPTAVGVFNVSVMVTDRANLSAAANVTVEVNGLTAIAVFGARAPVIDLGQELNLSVVLVGGTAPYSYFYSGLPPNCVSFDTPNLTCLPGALGSYTVSVLVNDSFGSAADAVTDVVINAAPSISSYDVGPTYIDVGMPVTVQVAAVGGTQPFQYAYDDLPPGCAGATGPDVTCTPTAAGNFTVEVIVTDGAGFVLNESAPLFVAPQFSGPTLTATPTPIDAGEVLMVTTSTMGGTAPLTYEYVGLPVGCGGGTTSSFTCRPGPGTFQTTVTVSDAVGASVTATHVFVIDPQLGLQLATENTTQVGLGHPISISVVPVGGTPPFQFSFAGLPAGCSSTNTSNLTCTPTEVGTFEVTVTLTDAAGERSSVNAVVKVSAPQSWWVPLLIASGITGATLVAVVLIRRGQRRRRSLVPGATTGNSE